MRQELVDATGLCVWEQGEDILRAGWLSSRHIDGLWLEGPHTDCAARQDGLAERIPSSSARNLAIGTAPCRRRRHTIFVLRSMLTFDMASFSSAHFLSVAENSLIGRPLRRHQIFLLSTNFRRLKLTAPVLKISGSHLRGNQHLGASNSAFSGLSPAMSK